MRALLGEIDRLVQAADLVDEANLPRLLAGPDAALCNFVHLLGRHVASRRRALDELVVDQLHRLLDLRTLLGRESSIR